jgi:hypothetical protein
MVLDLWPEQTRRRAGVGRGRQSGGGTGRGHRVLDRRQYYSQVKLRANPLGISRAGNNSAGRWVNQYAIAKAAGTKWSYLRTTG